MTQSKLKDAAIEFSVRVIELCDSIYKHKSLLNQLERAATSSGQTFTRQIMRRAKGILLPNCKLH